MVDGITITLDVVETSLYFLAPGLLWLFLFLLAFGDAELARASGFGRATFWLLLPFGLLGEFANVLIFGFRTDLLAVNVGGGLVPVLLAVLLLRETAPGGSRGVPSLLGTMAVGSAGALLAFLFLTGPLVFAGVAVATAAPIPVLYLLERRRSGPGDEVAAQRAGLLGIFAFAVLLTGLTTATIPGVGIVSAFPEYLLVPTGLGAATVLLYRRRLGGSFGPPLALAYASVTLGVLVGADVLHQPPLYNGGPGALYAIGGAGLLDLLYLSGLLALLGGYGLARYLDRGTARRAAEAPVPSSGLRRMRHAWYLGLEGRHDAALREAQRGTVEAVATLRTLAGAGSPPPGDPWAGLGVPAWVRVDQANLDAVARRPGTSGREAYRGWLTARALVGVAHQLANRYRATSRTRCFAFALDLLVLSLLTLAGDIAVLVPLHQNLGQLVNGVPLNAVIVAPVGWGLVYFLVAEGGFGTTLGKSYFGLVVTGRDGRPPGPRAILLRNLPRVVPLSLVAYGLGFGVAVVAHPLGSTLLAGYGSAAVYLIGLATALTAGFAIVTLVSVAAIATTEEGQRLGDLVAETWVLRARPTAGAPVPGAVGPAAPAASPPAGA